MPAHVEMCHPITASVFKINRNNINFGQDVRQNEFLAIQSQFDKFQKLKMKAEEHFKVCMCTVCVCGYLLEWLIVCRHRKCLASWACCFLQQRLVNLSVAFLNHLISRNTPMQKYFQEEVADIKNAILLESQVLCMHMQVLWWLLCFLGCRFVCAVCVSPRNGMACMFCSF
jgi:hypothetical protein